MTSDGSISWAIAAAIALLGVDLPAAQAGTNRLGLCRLRHRVFAPGHDRRNSTDYRTARRIEAPAPGFRRPKNSKTARQVRRNMS